MPGKREKDRVEKASSAEASLKEIQD